MIWVYCCACDYSVRVVWFSMSVSGDGRVLCYLLGIVHFVSVGLCVFVGLWLGVVGLGDVICC